MYWRGMVISLLVFGMALMGWTKVVAAGGGTDASLNRDWPDVDELPQVTSLPDPLAMFDGTPVASLDQWRNERRPELISLFGHYMYGHLPPAPPEVQSELVVRDVSALDGKATLEVHRLRFEGKPPLPLHMLLLIPNDAAGPVPVFFGMNFGGIHTITDHPDVPITTAWVRSNQPGVVDNRATEDGRGGHASRWPVHMPIEQGYAVATIYCGDISPDRDNAFDEGVHVHTLQEGQQRPGPHEWFTIAAWSWGLHRVVDYLYEDDRIDNDGLIVIGHSRLGKTALLAGALDERIAIVIPSQAGCGGTSPSRFNVGESVGQINSSFPHWFNDTFKLFSSDVERLPFDQHCLMALVAPRLLLLTNATEDTWADPRGQFNMLVAAAPVYELHGIDQPLATTQFPDENVLIDSNLGYFIRPGRHSMTAAEWEAWLTFCDQYLVPEAVPEEIVLAEDGAWGYAGRHALAGNGKLFFSYLDNAGYTWVGAYESETGEIDRNRIWQGDADLHSSNPLVIRSDGRVQVFLDKGAYVDRRIRWKVSEEPWSVAAFGELQESELEGDDIQGRQFYPMVHQSSGAMYLINNARDGDGVRKTVMWRSDDGGDTWGAHNELWALGQGLSGNRCYTRSYLQGDSIHMVTVRVGWGEALDGHAIGMVEGVYYIRFDVTEGSFYRADGTRSFGLDDLPMNSTSAFDVIWHWSDDGNQRQRAVWSDIVASKDGRPYVAFAIQDAVPRGVSILHEGYWAKPNEEGDWQYSHVATLARGWDNTPERKNYSIAIDPEDPYTVYVAKSTVATEDLSQVHRMRRADDGGNWKSEAFFSSSGRNTTVVVPRKLDETNVPSKVLWMNGRHEGWRSYDARIITHIATTIPAEPATISYPENSMTGIFTVSWFGAAAATSYELARSDDDGMTWETIYSGSSISHDEFVDDGVYLYRVRAVNAKGNSAWRTGDYTCTVEMAPPPAPASIDYPASSTTGRYVIEWTSSEAATEYELQSSSDGGNNWTEIFAGDFLSFDDMVDDGEHRYRVRGVNVEGPGEWRTGTHDCVVTMTSMEQWRRDHFDDPWDEDTANPMADPNNDRITNLVKYALRGDPHADDGALILPRLQRDSLSGDLFFNFRVRAVGGVIDEEAGVYTVEEVSYYVELANEPGAETWSQKNLTEDTAELIENADGPSLRVHIKNEFTGSSRGFARLIILHSH